MVDTVPSVLPPKRFAMSQTGTRETHVADAVEYRPQPGFGDAERQHILGRRMQHRLHIRARRVDRGMDECAPSEGRANASRRLPVEVELHDVVYADRARIARAREQEALRVGRMAHADIPERIEQSQIRQDPVGDHQILDRARQISHGVPFFMNSAQPRL